MTKVDKASQLIKEAKAAKKLAHFNETLLKNITHILPQYVFWKDANSIYLGCNLNYARLLGFSSPEDIIGKTDYDIRWLPVGDTAKTFQEGDKDTISGHPITNHEETLALPNGQTLTTLVSKLPIRDGKKVIGLIGYFSDITDLKQKEKDLIEQKKAAEAANEAKSAFIANMSHDIRTPLSGMIGMARILSKNLEHSTEKEIAKNLLQSSQFLLDLLNDVLEITKLAADKLPVSPVEFNLKKLISNIYHLEKPSSDKKKLTLSIRHINTLPDTLIGDRTRVHRILLNLIGNAIKFTDAGYIQIITEIVKQKNQHLIIKISVKDSGIGISKENQSTIFSRFSRVESAQKGSHQGTGIGLSLVKQFISEIQGEIYVKSELGKGSTFACIFPLRIAQETAPQKKIKPPQQTTPIYSTKKYKVLLVEDTNIAMLATKRLLEDYNCDVVEATTGEEAIKIARKQPFDIMFVDIGLPGISGLAASKAILNDKRSMHPPAPIVALTAHIDHKLSAESAAIGIKKIICKPLTDEIAQITLAELINPKKN